MLISNKHCRSEIVTGEVMASLRQQRLYPSIKENKDCYGEFTRLSIVVSITIEQGEPEFWLARPFQSLFTGRGIFIS